MRVGPEEWLRCSLSVWEVQKSSEERQVDHPTVYPVAMVRRLLRCCLNTVERGVVLDPFLGSGSTLIAAMQEQLSGVGFELVPRYADLAIRRLNSVQLPLTSSWPPCRVGLVCRPGLLEFKPGELDYYVVNDNALNLEAYLPDGSVDMVVTSPPYWSILNRPKTAQRKPPSPYSDLADDLGNCRSYEEFLATLSRILQLSARKLKPSGRMVVNVGDIRVGERFFPLHLGLVNSVSEFLRLDDIIVWDRRKAYGNLLPLGFPNKFIVNKVHEYLLLFGIL